MLLFIPAIPAVVLWGGGVLVATLLGGLSGCKKEEEKEGGTQSPPIPNDWITVPAGSFERGDKESSWDDEKPVKDIYVSAFQFQKHGVTHREYRGFLTAQKGKPFEAIVQCGSDNPVTISKPTRDEFMDEYDSLHGVCDSIKSFTVSMKSYPAEPVDYGSKFNGENQPVVGVDWFGAAAYCQSIGAKLPTEAEREKAARGKSGHDKYATSDPNVLEKEGKKLAHYGFRNGSTANVCSYGLSSLGFCDLTGNDWEWTTDWYRGDAYTSLETRNPKGPVNGRSRVLRGGSCFSRNPDYLRAAGRYHDLSVDRYLNIGFRCARQGS